MSVRERAAAAHAAHVTTPPPGLPLREGEATDRLRPPGGEVNIDTAFPCVGACRKENHHGC